MNVSDSTSMLLSPTSTHLLHDDLGDLLDELPSNPTQWMLSDFTANHAAAAAAAAAAASAAAAAAAAAGVRLHPQQQQQQPRPKPPSQHHVTFALPPPPSTSSSSSHHTHHAQPATHHVPADLDPFRPPTVPIGSMSSALALAAASHAVAPRPIANIPTSLPTLLSDDLMSSELPQIQKLFSPPKPPQKWTAIEDDLLREAVAELGCRRWKIVAQRVPGRNHIQCLQRWNKVLKPGIRKGTWTPEEDKVVIESVAEQNGEPNWSVVAAKIPGRTAKQCRERWRCNLDPNILKSAWSPEEDNMLFTLQKKVGNRWALISKSLPGRTENAIKTRFRSFQRQERKKWTVEEDTMIRAYDSGNIEFETLTQRLHTRSRNAIRKRLVWFRAANSTSSASSTPSKTLRKRASSSSTANASTRLKRSASSAAAAAAVQALVDADLMPMTSSSSSSHASSSGSGFLGLSPYTSASSQHRVPGEADGDGKRIRFAAPNLDDYETVAAAARSN